MIIDTILGRPSQYEKDLWQNLYKKNEQRDVLLNDPDLSDPREAFDTRIHSLVCRKRNILDRVTFEAMTIQIKLGDERSRARNERTFYLLVLLVAYLVVNSVIPLDDVARAIKLYLHLA